MSRISKDNIDKFYEFNILIETRTLYLGADKSASATESDQVDTSIAETMIKGLHILDSTNQDKPITIILNTPGGRWHQGFAIYDAIKSCESHVIIKAIGQCMSMGTVIMQAGDERLIYPNTTFMIHEGEDGFHGHARDFERWAEYCKVMRKRLYEIYAEKSGHPVEYWRRKCANDYIMTADQAAKEGLVDNIITPPSQSSRP